jgi:hypothetical protein
MAGRKGKFERSAERLWDFINRQCRYSDWYMGTAKQVAAAMGLKNHYSIRYWKDFLIESGRLVYEKRSYPLGNGHWVNMPFWSTRMKENNAVSEN